MNKTNRWFISGPSVCAYVDKHELIEPIIKSLCEVTGDDTDDYTATLIEDENE